MSLRHIMKDSLGYSISNWIKVIILGLVIFIADLVNEISSFGTTAVEIKIILIMGGIMLAIFETGYVFRIVEESTHGSAALPRFDKLWGTFVHGLKEILITIIYFVAPFVLILVGIAQIDVLVGPISQEFDLLFIILGLVLASLLYVPYQAAILNMADHHGTLRSGFDFKKISQKIQKMGFKNLGFIYVLTVFFTVVVGYTLTDTLSILPYGLGDIISGLLLAPLILIFTARALGLINRDLDV